LSSGEHGGSEQGGALWLPDHRQHPDPARPHRLHRRPGRHLQGCYADPDGLASTLAVLRRTT
jgi:hypothetical protein